MNVKLHTDLSFGGRIYYQDQKYDLPDNLAWQLVTAGQAELVQDLQPAKPKASRNQRRNDGQNS